jgi:hypothetical protein
MYSCLRGTFPPREVLSARSLRWACVSAANWGCALADSYLVLSLVGVILIARPPFIFGAAEGEPDAIEDASDTPTREVTPEQRLVAVG